MKTIRLKYVGSLETCGLLAINSGRSYTVRRGHVFSVPDDDAEMLLKRYGDLLVPAQKAKDRSKKDAGRVVEEDQKPSASGDGAESA